MYKRLAKATGAKGDKKIPLVEDNCPVYKRQVWAAS